MNWKKITLLVGPSLVMLSFLSGTIQSQVRADQPPRVSGAMMFLLSGQSRKPEWVAATSSLIIRGKIAKKMPANSVVGHPIRGRRGRGDYGWHDFLVKPVDIIWKDKNVPNVGNSLWVRVYRANTPDIQFIKTDEPEFLEGEQYVLMLRDVDGLAFNVDPAHWTVSCGTRGAFLIEGDKVRRKDPISLPILSLAELKAKIAQGVSNASSVAGHRRAREVSPKGIVFQ